jgi:hypothetical protein
LSNIFELQQIISDYYMLGDQISEEKGKITSQRVLDVEGGVPKIELLFQRQGTIEV